MKRLSLSSNKQEEWNTNELENDTKKETIIIEFQSDIDCLNEKELVSEIVGMTNTEGVISREQRRRWR